MSDGLTHLDAKGRARMVNVGDKSVTHRVAIARCEVHMAAETLERIAQGNLPKGDVMATARLAGIQAAKRTDEWIPLCHSLPLDGISVDLTPDPTGPCVRIEAKAEVHAKTGVEMEALVAVSAAALTLYDMCKAVDRGMQVQAVRLVEKRGGRSGDWQRPGEPTTENPHGEAVGPG
jgi:cyclic pyranopterin phosphate synthase